MQFQRHDLTVEVREGDITRLDTDAITNAANSHLILGAGVAGAIASAGGPSIQRECNEIGGCPVGKAVMTGGGNLMAKYVIHAVGPYMGQGDEHAKLASAIRSTLEVADENHLESVALPAISTGIFGFPMADCAEIMVREIMAFADRERQSLTRVVVCLYGQTAFNLFLQTFQNLWADDSSDSGLHPDRQR